MVDNDDSAEALNRYRGFFLPARDALLWMSLLQFAKVFDRDPRTASLRNLLNAAKTNQAQLAPSSTTEELNNIGQEIDNKQEILERLQRVRSQRIAHHDAIKSGDSSVLYGEVRQLVEDIKSMYNKLRCGHDGVTTSFDRLARDAERHTFELIQIMRDERTRAIQRMREINTSGD